MRGRGGQLQNTLVKINIILSTTEHDGTTPEDIGPTGSTTGLASESITRRGER